MYFRWKYLF